MAKSKIKELLVPEVFNNYVNEKITELSALVQSGIIQHDPQLDSLASSGGRIINMPYLLNFTDEDEVLATNKELNAEDLKSDKTRAIVLQRGKAFRVNDLEQNLAVGNSKDLMSEVASRVAQYWVAREQAILLSTLKGIFGDGTRMEGNTYTATPVVVEGLTAKEAKIAGSTPGKINGVEFVKAKNKLGDHSSQLKAVAMHSDVLTELEVQQVIEYIQPAESVSAEPLPYYMGKRVIVDDSLVPDESGVYTTYLFAQGAFGKGNAVIENPFEYDRKALSGDNYLISRRGFVLHPIGLDYKDMVCEGETPTNAELANASNWERRFSNKAIPIVAFKHTI